MPPGLNPGEKAGSINDLYNALNPGQNSLFRFPVSMVVGWFVVPHINIPALQFVKVPSLRGLPNSFTPRTPPGTPPPSGWRLPGLPPHAYTPADWPAWGDVLDNVRLYGSPGERALLELLNISFPAPVWGVSELTSDVMQWVNTGGDRMAMVGNQIMTLWNYAAFMLALRSYPWPLLTPPEVIGYWKQAFWEGQYSSKAPLAALLKGREGPPLLSFDEARTFITLALMQDWDRITDRVSGLAHQAAAGAAREQKQFEFSIMIASTILTLGIGAGAGLLISSAVSAGLKAMNTVEQVQFQHEMNSWAAQFQQSNPAFAAEIARVAALAPPPDLTPLVAQTQQQSAQLQAQGVPKNQADAQAATAVASAAVDNTPSILALAKKPYVFGPVGVVAAAILAHVTGII